MQANVCCVAKIDPSPFLVYFAAAHGLECHCTKTVPNVILAVPITTESRRGNT